MAKKGFTRPRARNFLLGTGLSHGSGHKGGFKGGFKRNLSERKILVFLLRCKESEQRKRTTEFAFVLSTPIFRCVMTAAVYCFERLLAKCLFCGSCSGLSVVGKELGDFAT